MAQILCNNNVYLHVICVLKLFVYMLHVGICFSTCYMWTDVYLHVLVQMLYAHLLTGPLALSVTSSTADPGVTSSIPARSPTFVKL